MKTMTYRGYTTEIIYSQEDECFVGHVVDPGDDIIGFHGDTDAELRTAFEDVVDLHIIVDSENKFTFSDVCVSVSDYELFTRFTQMRA